MPFRGTARQRTVHPRISECKRAMNLLLIAREKGEDFSSPCENLPLLVTDW